MNTRRDSKQPEEQGSAILKKLLGSLELEIMDFMWQVDKATVQKVTRAINRRRAIAYTTVMTVMGHLVEKELLARTKEGKKYRYQLARSREQFLRESCQSMIRTLVNDFGDLAVAQFLGEVDKADVDRLAQLRSLVRETSDENTSE